MLIIKKTWLNVVRITSCKIRHVVYLVKVTSREKVFSLNIYISDGMGLFTVSILTNCGKFRYQIDIISKTYSYVKSAITLWVKHAHLVALGDTSRRGVYR